MMESYFTLADIYSPEEVFTSILTFTRRVDDYKDSKDSLHAGYRLVVKKGVTAGLLTRVRESLMYLSSLPYTVPSELKYLEFFLRARK